MNFSFRSIIRTFALTLCFVLSSAVLTRAAESGQTLPAGTSFQVRLTQAIGSFSARKGTEVVGTVIEPVMAGDHVVIPPHSTIKGSVIDCNRVGLGLVHETAHLTIAFQTLILPDGKQIPLSTQLSQLDNARETVDQKGQIKGIRSTDTLGYRVDNAIAGFAMADPIAYIYVNVASARVLRFSEPEIWLPAGSELGVKLVSALTLEADYPSPAPPLDLSSAERFKLERLVRSLPYRTTTERYNKKSDVTNLVFLGEPDALRRAFQAAGWAQVDRLSTMTGFMTLRSIAENQRYQAAPMSLLLLDEQPPFYEISKSLNTFSKRHHARLWLRPERFDKLPVITASSTQDIGIQLSRKNRTFIHVIDTNIDNERRKIVNDLVFTGCVAAAGLVPRPWIPQSMTNGTGETLMTDRKIAVLKLNDCTDPIDSAHQQTPVTVPATGTTVQRGFRQGFLMARNDIYRGNLIYQGYTGTRYGIKYLKGRKSGLTKPNATGADSLSTLDLDPSLELEQGPPEPITNSTVPEAASEPAAEHRREEAPAFFEFAVQAGWLRFGNTLDSTNIDVQSSLPEVPSFSLFLQNRLYNGWELGTSLTLNPWNRVSSEFAYDHQHGKYRIGVAFSGFSGQDALPFQEQTTGLITNQIGYATLFHFTGRTHRIRPYVAVGPTFQFMHITDAPFKKAGGIFRVGLRNVGLILAAYDFANTPPLDGGGIFQFGFQYGGGIKYRVSRRWMARFDFRETLSAQPNFIGRSIEVNSPTDTPGLLLEQQINHPAGPLRMQKLTLGAAFVF